MAARSRRRPWLLVVVSAAVLAGSAHGIASSRATTDVPEARAAVLGAMPSVSGDGRFVAFAGAPPAGDARASTVWLDDRSTGAVVELTTPVAGVRLGNSVKPSISSDGCVVAVLTEMAYDLYRDDDTDQRWDVYRRVLPACGGGANGWELVSSVPGNGVPSRADGRVDPADRPAISASGSVIAYTTQFGSAVRDATAVVVADLTVPVDDARRSTRVAGTPVVAPDTTFRYRGLRQPSLSADGSAVAFTADVRADLPTPTWGIGPAPGGFAASQVYVWDRLVDDPSLAVTAASAGGGQANGDGRSPALSADGRFVAFESTSTNLVAGVAVPPCGVTCVPEVYRFDRTDRTVAVVSRSADGSAAADLGATQPAISADGSHIAFVTRATNLMPTNPSVGGEATDGDIIVADVASGVLRRASTQSDGVTPAPAANAHPQLSATGRVVVFDSLVGGVFPSAGVPTAPVRDPALPFVARQVVAVAQQPVLTLSDLDVGTVAVGVAGPEWSVSVVNRGPSTFVPATVTSSSRDFAITGGTCGLGMPVAPGAWCTVLIVLTPSHLGPITGTVEITERGFEPVAVSAGLAGAGGEPVLAPTDPDGVLLAPTVVGRQSDPVEVSISNVGFLPTRIRSAEVVGVNPDDFHVDAARCTRVLEAGSACPVVVTFTPTAAGYRTAVVNVTTTTGQYTSVLVTGDGQYQPAIAVGADLILVGRSVEVSGSGFPAGATLVLSWSDDPGHATTVVADETGAFVTSFPVSPVERGGNRQLVAQAPDAVASVDVEVARTTGGHAGRPQWPGR